ncbi:MAG: EAL domain-containing protein [Cyanobacteria bacterium J06607_13]
MIEAVSLVLSVSVLTDDLVGNSQAQLLLSTYLKNAQIGAMAFEEIVDTHGKTVDFLCTLENPYALENGAGRSLLGKRLVEELPFHRDPKLGLFDQYCRSIRGESLTRELEVEELGWFEVHSFPLDKGFGVTFVNITEHKLAAIVDPLTGLLNRNALDTVTGFDAVLYVDLDRFKQVNDAHGHDMGDRLLRRAADCIQKATRQADLTIRLGGDEFLVVMRAGHDCKVEQIALNAAQRIVDLVSEPLTFEGLPIEISASVGVYICEQRGEELDPAMRRADTALGRRKNDRAKYPPVTLYCPSMSEQVEAQERFEVELRQALRNREIVLHYQRIVDLQSPHYPTIGFEALARWQHPTRGLLTPDKFIEFAEQAGMIGLLTDYVLAEAYKAACRWSSLDHPLKMAVNLAAYDLGRRRFIDNTRDVLGQGSLQSGYISFELTETAFADVSQQELRGALMQLVRLGAKISIDDLGTGWNGINILNALKTIVAEIKIDKSFVSGPDASPEICSALKSLAGHFNIRVVAEGIETREQAEVLAATGIEYGQGYYFESGKPMPEAEVDAMLLKEWASHKLLT